VIVVEGEPEQAGSKRSVPAGGRPGAPRFITDDNKKAKGWMKEVGKAAMVAMSNGRHEKFDGVPLVMEIEFFVTRPKTVKPHKRLFPTVKPDLTKLVRACEDGLTGIVWVDDSAVVDQHVFKRYADDTSPRAVICVYEKA
jgi:Holliday junction resolvase RusA-like endonuclease